MGFALLITGLAGMATTIGAGAAFFASRQNSRLLPRALAFSAGVMLCVSLAELLPTALTELQAGLLTPGG